MDRSRGPLPAWVWARFQESNLLKVLAGQARRKKLDRVQLLGACWAPPLLCLSVVPRSPRQGMRPVFWTCPFACYVNLGSSFPHWAPAAWHLMKLGEIVFKSPTTPSVLGSPDVLEFFSTNLQSRCPARARVERKSQGGWEGRPVSLLQASKVRIACWRICV